MSVTSYACGICGAGFGCDGAAFAAHMHAAHQLEMLTPRVMMSREEYECLTIERDALAERVRELEAAGERLRAKLVSEYWREDEGRWWQSCSVCDAGGPKGPFRHFDDCELGAALAASRQPEAGAAVEATYAE